MPKIRRRQPNGMVLLWRQLLDYAAGVHYSCFVPRRSDKTRMCGFTAIALLLVGAAAFCIRMHDAGFISVSGEDSVTISTEALARDQVKFYSYHDRAGDELRFILGRDSGGEVHAAMDACQRCYVYRQGYSSSHGYLVCKLCGNRYRLDAMTSGMASCVPVKLSLKMAGQKASIATAELERHRGMF